MSQNRSTDEQLLADLRLRASEPFVNPLADLDGKRRRKPLRQVDGNLRVHPCALQAWIAALKRLNKFRYRNSDIGLKGFKERFGVCVFPVVTPHPAHPSPDATTCSVPSLPGGAATVCCAGGDGGAQGEAAT